MYSNYVHFVIGYSTFLNLILFQTQDKLLAENEALRSQLNVQGEQIDTLKAHIGVIRQHTITFILDQMDTLHMQRDTEV
jgi:RAS guanyl-releasing protein 3